MSTAHPHGPTELPPPQTREVSDGIFAYLQPDGSWGLNNTGFIVGKDGLVAVDTCFTESRTRALLEAMRRVTHLPVRTLVNTHHHGDHTNGNYLLPSATIVGHELCRQTLMNLGVSGASVNPLFPNVQWGELRLSPPDLTFQESLTIYCGDLRLKLLYVGPAHTTNDVVVWVPERRLLFSGDVIFHQGTPFVPVGSVAGSLLALERLRELGAWTIVPGHGPVCGPQVIDDMVAYLRFIQEVARGGYESGLAPLEAARQTELGRFADWHDSERLVGNLHRAYSELRGEPLGTELDLGVIVSEMITFNGGPVRCLA